MLLENESNIKSNLKFLIRCFGKCLWHYQRWFGKRDPQASEILDYIEMARPNLVLKSPNCKFSSTLHISLKYNNIFLSFLISQVDQIQTAKRTI